MAGEKQKIRSVLVPELGLNLEPEYVKELEIGTDFSRTLSHLVGQTGSRSIVIRATSDGRLMVAAAATAMEVYLVETGAAPDAFNAGSTFVQVNAIYSTDILIELNDLTIQFRNQAGVWGDNISCPVGFRAFDFIHYGIRVQNRVALAIGDYEIAMYR